MRVADTLARDAAQRVPQLTAWNFPAIVYGRSCTETLSADDVRSARIGVTGIVGGLVEKVFGENPVAGGEFSAGGEARFPQVFVEHAARPASYTGIPG